jgi:hypothetical protein
LKIVKALKVGIIALQLITVLVLAISLHTLFSGLSSAVSTDGLSLKVNADESTGDLLFLVRANPRNSGFLGLNLFFEAGLLNLDEECIAKNSTSINIDAGAQHPFTLTLRVQAEDVKDNHIDQNQGILEITFRISTLGDRVGFTNTLRVRGGEEARTVE